MMLEELNLELHEEGRIKRLENRTSIFYNFNYNMGIALVLPTLKYGPDSDTDWGVMDYAFLCQTSIVQIITGLETYYQDIFYLISKNLKISKTNISILSKFIKKNRLMNSYFDILKTKNSLDFDLASIVPDNISFQNKEKIQIAMSLLNLDPINKFNKEWERTFGSNENSTVKLRHKFVHRGIDLDNLGKIDEIFIKERIKDAITLVYNLEEQININYPKKEIKELYV